MSEPAFVCFDFFFFTISGSFIISSRLKDPFPSLNSLSDISVIMYLTRANDFDEKVDDHFKRFFFSNEWEDKPPEWEKMFAKHAFDRGVLSRISKACLKLNNKNLLKKWAKDMNRNLTKECMQTCYQRNHIKWCPASSIIRELQIKTAVFHGTF